MARIRNIKPTFFASEDIAALTFRARLTFIGLWTQADDEGRLKANPKIIKGAIWPLDDDVNADDVAQDLDELERGQRIRRYDVDGVTYLEVQGWAHQKPNKPTPSRLPSPPWATATNTPDPDPARPAPRPVQDKARSTTGTVRDESRGEREGGEGKGRGRGARGTAPAVHSGATAPPPPAAPPAQTCPDHPAGTTEPCRACGDARRAYQARQATTITAVPPPLAVLATTPRCDAHGAELGRCALCRASAGARAAPRAAAATA